MPKLSIITINLNNAIGLRKTIESVVNQTYKDFEYIIIDGGSTDDSVKVMTKFADKISYWISEPDKGIYNAMNKGILNSNGDFVQFLNSGDYLVNNTIFQQIFKTDLYGDIIYTNGYNLDRGIYLSEFVIPDSIDLNFLTYPRLFHQGALIKKSLFYEIGLYSEEYSIISDAEFFIKALLRGNKFQKVNLGSVVVEPGGISRTNSVGVNKELSIILRNCLGDNYLQLYLEKKIIQEQLDFLLKSKILKYLMNHKGNFLINKIIRIF